jgi:transcriptional regulator with XRE-family HTH domain
MKKGVLGKYVRSLEEELIFAEEAAAAQTAIAVADMISRAGITHRDLANRVGVTEARISQIVNANSNPTIKTLARLCKAAGGRLNIEFVISGETYQNANPWPRGHLTLVTPQWQPTNENGNEETVNTECASSA